MRKDTAYKAWTAIKVLFGGYFIVSGLFVLNWYILNNDEKYLAHAEDLPEEQRQQQVYEELKQYSNDDLLSYLATNALDSDYVKTRQEIATETFTSDKVLLDLDNMKLKVMSGLLFKEEYLGEHAERSVQLQQEEIERQRNALIQ